MSEPAEKEVAWSRKERSQFLGEVSVCLIHELKNSMTVMNYAIESLLALEERGDLPYDLRESHKLLLKLTRCADRMTQIFESSRMLMEGDQATETKTISITDLVNDLRILLSDFFESYRIHFEIVENYDAKLKLVTVPHQVIQIILNLALNARDALEGEPGRVRFVIWPDSAHLVFDVEDDGPGVFSELKDSIFESGFSAKESSNNSGLGLSISRQIARRYRGDLTLDHLKAPTRFRLRLPRH